MTKVYMVRHGQSEANINRIWGGDYPLTALGRLQAESVPGSIAERPDAVFSSCRIRAFQTACTAYPGYDIEQYPEFDEIFTGRLEDTAYDRDTAAGVRNDPALLRDVYGGDDLNMRAEEALKKIHELAEGRETIVIFSSDYLICSIRSLLDHGTADLMCRYKMQNCEAFCITI